MQNGRDSSVWRSLAVAFGDGLAFGVGMKLTQNAGRAPAAAPPGDLNSLALRLEQIEQRIAEIEQRPPALAPVEKAPPPSHPLDQNALEAVIAALDARLQEHAGHVERRITELQAKLTIELTTLHRQHCSIAEGLQARIEELQAHSAGQLAVLRDAAEADRRETGRQFVLLRGEMAGLVADTAQSGVALRHRLTGELDALRKSAESDRQSVQEQIATLHHDVADLLTTQLLAVQHQFREELRDTMGAVAATAASTAHAAVEEHLAPLRTAVEAKDHEIADLLQGVGEICRRAAQHVVAPPVVEEAAPPAAAETGHLPPGEIPAFAQSQPPGKLWRVPLVSSLVLSTGVMLMRHYL